MTLVLTANISGRFAIMTSDTRRVKLMYDKEALEKGIVEFDRSIPPVIYDQKDIKTHQVNDFVLLGAGGTASLATYLVDILKKEIKEEHDLSDCKRILESVIKRERANKDDGPYFLDFLDMEWAGVTVLLSGFYRDGCTGIVQFSSGSETEVLEQKAPKGGYQYQAIAPAQEYSNMFDDMFKIDKLDDPSTYEDLPSNQVGNIMLQTVAGHLMQLHNVISYNHPVEISPDYEVHVIALNRGKHEYNKFTFDATETHKQLDNAK